MFSMRRSYTNTNPFLHSLSSGLLSRILTGIGLSGHWRLFVLVSFVVHFYPRDAMLARVIVIASVRPSVCPSVMRRYCVKTKKASVMVSSPSGSPKTLVFWRQITSPYSKGFPRLGASNKGRSEKFSDFPALSVNISKTVADTAKVTISD